MLPKMSAGAAACTALGLLTGCSKEPPTAPGGDSSPPIVSTTTNPWIYFEGQGSSITANWSGGAPDTLIFHLGDNTLVLPAPPDAGERGSLTATPVATLPSTLPEDASSMPQSVRVEMINQGKIISASSNENVLVALSSQGPGENIFASAVITAQNLTQELGQITVPAGMGKVVVRLHYESEFSETVGVRLVDPSSGLMFEVRKIGSQCSVITGGTNGGFTEYEATLPADGSLVGKRILQIYSDGISCNGKEVFAKINQGQVVYLPR